MPSGIKFFGTNTGSNVLVVIRDDPKTTVAGNAVRFSMFLG